MDENILRALVDLRDRAIQKNRIGFSNRLDAISRGVDVPSNGTVEILNRWLARFDELESELDVDIANATKGIEIIERMIEVKGIGRILAAKVVCVVDIHRANTISALWKYAGYGMDANGKRDKPTSGVPLPYNARLHSTCFLIAGSFLKCNSPYRAIYDSSREYYTEGRDWTPLHIHRAACSRMVKMWLSHLWLIWRQIEGLPIRAPYVHEHLGHTHIYLPEDFGWSAIE